LQANITRTALGKAKSYLKESKNKEFQSAYKKDQFFNFCEVDELGIDGDIQVDKRFHGGVDKAIHIGSSLHFKKYQKEHQCELDKLAFGCNILIDSYDENDIYVGDIYSIGDIEIQVTQPRQPCWKIGELFGKTASRYIIKNYATGWYVRVLNGGTLDINDKMILKERLSDVSIKDMSRYLHIPPSDDKVVNKILSFEFVAKAYKEDLLRATKRS